MNVLEIAQRSIDQGEHTWYWRCQSNFVISFSRVIKLANGLTALLIHDPSVEEEKEDDDDSVSSMSESSSDSGSSDEEAGGEPPESMDTDDTPPQEKGRSNSSEKMVRC